jgi:hypothetical protein
MFTAGWTGKNLQIAMAIAKAESGWNPTATNKNSNGSTDYGLMQINSIHKPTVAEQTRPIENARKGREIFTTAGSKFTPWVTYNNGSYKKFMNDAADGIKQWSFMPADMKAAIIKDDGGNTATVESSNPLSGIPEAIAGVGNAVGGFTTTINNLVENVAIVLVAVVLLIIGVMFLTRKTTTDVAGGIAKAVV